MLHPLPDWHPLCPASALVDGGLAVDFDVVYAGQTCRAFAIRHAGLVHAYLNRCTHVAMELDWQPNRFFDRHGLTLVCGAHGATFDPATGACTGGPGRGGLFKIAVQEIDGHVWWQSQYHLIPCPI